MNHQRAPVISGEPSSFVVAPQVLLLGVPPETGPSPKLARVSENRGFGDSLLRKSQTLVHDQSLSDMTHCSGEWISHHRSSFPKSLVFFLAFVTVQVHTRFAGLLSFNLQSSLPQFNLRVLTNTLLPPVSGTEQRDSHPLMDWTTSFDVCALGNIQFASATYYPLPVSQTQDVLCVCIWQHYPFSLYLEWWTFKQWNFSSSTTPTRTWRITALTYTGASSRVYTWWRRRDLRRAWNSCWATGYAFIFTPKFRMTWASGYLSLFSVENVWIQGHRCTTSFLKFCSVSCWFVIFLLKLRKN